MLKNLTIAIFVLPLIACKGIEDGDSGETTNSDSKCKQGKYDLIWLDEGASSNGNIFTTKENGEHSIEVCEEDTKKYLPELLGKYKIYAKLDSESNELLDCSMHHYNYSLSKHILHCQLPSTSKDYYFTISSTNKNVLEFYYEWDSSREYYMTYWKLLGMKNKALTTLEFNELGGASGFSFDMAVQYEYPQQ